ncbi:MAG: nuclear transport factor 2 family protein [Acetobacteraceae bacterium]|nr:nuclear transport factor 2 family protein [Acetobacteraceae bacterium]
MLIRQIGACALVTGLLVARADAQSPATPATQTPAEQALQAAEQKWLDAYYRLDATALAANETTDFTMITPSMSVDRASQLASLRNPPSRGPLAPTTSYTIARQQIRVYGDVATIADVCTVGSTGGALITSSGTYWQTEVWHFEAGTWKIAHIHISMVMHGM